MIRSVYEAFFSRVQFSPTCWTWSGPKNVDGYGVFRLGGRRSLAHRVFYEIVYGPIEPGKVVDHRCRVRHCVNPNHLEAVDVPTNVLRGTGPSAVNAGKTSCTHGHPFDEANTYWRKTGGRRCRRCHTDQQLRRDLRIGRKNRRRARSDST